MLLLIFRYTAVHWVFTFISRGTECVVVYLLNSNWFHFLIQRHPVQCLKMCLLKYEKYKSNLVFTFTFHFQRHTECMAMILLKYGSFHFYLVFTFTFISRGTQYTAMYLLKRRNFTLSNVKTFTFIFRGTQCMAMFFDFHSAFTFTFYFRGTQCMAMYHLKRRTLRLHWTPHCDFNTIGHGWVQL